MNETSPPMVLPRGLIILAFFWMVASWGLAAGLQRPIRPSPSSYEPGVQLMLLFLMLGLMIGWPLYRLSQQRSHWPVRQTILDLAVLLAMAQVVVWPLRLVTSWSRERTAAMDASLVGWSLLAGAIVASAIGSERGGVRTLAMLACVALCLLGPAVGWLGAEAGVPLPEIVSLSPLLVMHTLGEESAFGPTAHEWWLIALLGLAGLTAWATLGVTRLLPMSCSVRPG